MSNSGSINIIGKTANMSYQAQSATITLTSENITNAMDVVGFQDQGREKIIELIQDKFQDLVLGRAEAVPTEFIESAESIMDIVNHLSKIFI
jgi:hypothetical protein